MNFKRFILLLAISAFCSLHASAAFSGRSYAASSTDAIPNGSVTQSLTLTLTNPTASAIAFQIGATSQYLSTYTVPANGSLTVTGASGALANLTWAGLSGSNSPVTANALSKSYTYVFRWGTSGAFTSASGATDAASASMVYDQYNSAIKDFTQAPQFATIAANSTTVVAGLPALARKEIKIGLYNRTGKVQYLQWGSTVLTLQPGMNEFRYDGPVTSNGLPAVGPSDFTGTPLTSPSGQNYVFANLVSSGSDLSSVAWSAPMLTPPASPTSTQDTVEILRDQTSSSGAFVAVHHSDGTTTLTTLPITIGQSTSNTTGTTSATISDPTTTKPTQTTGNTTTTVSNNTTNNTNQGGSTVIQTGGGSPSTPTTPSIDTSGPASTFDGTAPTNTVALQGLQDLGTGTQLVPSDATQTIAHSMVTASNTLSGKIESWNPFGSMTTLSGDYTSVSLPSRIGGGTVILPLDHPGIVWFRNCCLFAMYFLAVLKVMKILKI